MKKTCCTCKTPKELDDFPREPHTADGRNHECKSCKREKSKKKYLEIKKERELYF